MMISGIDIFYFSTRVKSFEIDGFRIVAEKKINSKSVKELNNSRNGMEWRYSNRFGALIFQVIRVL